MQKFKQHTGLVCPLDIANVDTDQIIPKQFLKSIKRTGFGVNLFDEWRYLDIGYPGQDITKRRLNPDFVLNLPRYDGASILLARENFGCGSSREHAPWALAEYGFKVIIAPSFADIFFNNSFKNGLLPLVLPADKVDMLFFECIGNEGYTLKVDLINQCIFAKNQQIINFDIDSFRKKCLVEGLDDIGLTLQNSDVIKQFELQHTIRFPWILNEINK